MLSIYCGVCILFYDRNEYLNTLRSISWDNWKVAVPLKMPLNHPPKEKEKEKEEKDKGKEEISMIPAAPLHCPPEGMSKQEWLRQKALDEIITTEQMYPLHSFFLSFLLLKINITLSYLILSIFYILLP